MGRPPLTLVAILCTAILILLGYLSPLVHAQPNTKTKIGFSDSDFLKINQANELVFVLSEYRTASQKEMNCLAKNIYYEARGESIMGMISIAQITINRADIKHNGKQTLCGVIHDPGQFSWVNKTQKRIDKKAWQQSIQVAQLVLLGVRIKGMNNALYFHSRKIKQPKWSLDLPVNKTIGNHIYF